MAESKQQAVITARDLTYTYASGGGIRGVDFTVPHSSMVAVRGASGAGKSTLLAVLGLILAPQSGTLALAGTDCTALTSRERDALRRDRLGIVLQDLGLLPFLSAWENVAAAFGPRFAPHESAARLELERLGMAELADSPATDLSGGQRQRVAVARAAVKQPALILADEPTASLDTDNAAAVMDAFRDAAQRGAAVLIATHDETTAAACDTEIRLRSGRQSALAVPAAERKTK